MWLVLWFISVQQQTICFHTFERLLQELKVYFQHPFFIFDADDDKAAADDEILMLSCSAVPERKCSDKFLATWEANVSKYQILKTSILGLEKYQM